MANITLKPVYFLAIFFIILLLANAEETDAAKKVCEKRSKTWSGVCTLSSHCDNQCRKWEGADHGACHQRYWVTRACFCYFKC
ncbi:defensin-like protein 1 [Mercurialis annua]|uniref:defensin-like protein 1 n=1 Tax=Mercurialis annua TaxID=3986 RepID=UPI00215F953E|nr:defensin-like protein 1 [Mercurialis annua]